MVGLPKTLTIGGTERQIRSNYKDCINIIIAFQDPDLTMEEKTYVMLTTLYVEEIAEDDVQEAIDQAIWFLNCGETLSSKKYEKPVYDWEQDEQIMFSALNHVAGYEIREQENVHFWTFISFFYELQEGLFSTIINIRDKKNKGKKLEKYEQDFYKANKELIDLKKKYSNEDRAVIDKLNRLLG